MMKITNILWLSKEALEGIVTIKSNACSIEAFCHPCHYKIGDTIYNPLLSLEEEMITKTEDESISVTKGNASFNYKIIAKVVDVSEHLVSVDGILIQLSLPLPKDIIKGEDILFYSSRLDVI